MFPVWRLSPGFKNPTSLISGQSVCSGWGSEYISCGRESLLTKVTWLPLATVMFLGLTASLAIVIVGGMPPPPGDGVGDGEGLLLDPPPHAASRIPIDPAQRNHHLTSIPDMLEEFSRDVEAHEPVLGLRSAACNLAHRRGEGIREVQLEHVAAEALFEREAAMTDARPIP